jgi:hypothetical protein
MIRVITQLSNFRKRIQVQREAFFLSSFFVFRCLSCEIVISFGIDAVAITCYMRHKFIILQLIEKWPTAQDLNDWR